MLYLVGGAMVNTMKTTNTINYLQTMASDQGVTTLTGNNTVHTSSSKWGSIFGIGGQQDIVHGLTLRLEYDHLNYKRARSLSNVLDATITPDPGSAFMGYLLTNSLAHLHNDRLTLGLTYHFS